jgi:hypothetical protein
MAALSMGNEVGERGKLEVKRVGEEIRTKTSSTRVNKKGDEIRGGYSEQ